MNENFMKEKPVLPLILSMSLPMVLSMMVNSLYNIVDSFFVAQISEDAMTALSLVYPVQNFINAIAIGFGVGMNAVIALHLGAGDEKKANMAATIGTVLSMVHAVILTIAGIAIMPGFLRMFTSSETVIDLGIRYSTIVFLFTTAIMLGLVFEKVFQAVGAMKVTMVGLTCGCVANIILDPVMIFGLGPFPAMGIEGAALATGLGQVLSLVIYIGVYVMHPIRVKIRKEYAVPEKWMVLRLYSIGIPATLNLALPSLLISALNAILAAFSEVYILVLGIYYKLQTFLYLPANGFVQGMRPLIGFNYGAGRKRQSPADIPHCPFHERDHHDFWHPDLSGSTRTVDRTFHPQPGDHTGRRKRASHHQRRLRRVCSFRYVVRGAGGTGQRRALSCYLPVPVCAYHHTGRFSPQPDLRRGRCVERLLDRGTCDCAGRLWGIPESGKIEAGTFGTAGV